jgi:beta-glucosidase-like glycosyl hydrolase
VRELAQLLLPSVRWDRSAGFGAARAAVTRALRSGIGGFVIEGGRSEDVAALAAGIRANADAAPIIALAPTTLESRDWRADPLPLAPIGAVASLRDLIAVRRSARAVAREARSAGCNALLAPSCDVPAMPSADTFATNPSEVAVAAAEWIDAAQAEGVMCIAGRFPGAGRVGSGVSGGPVVLAPDDVLYASDLVPFRAAIDAGVAGLLIADATYPSLDDGRTPAPLSRRILGSLLREQLGFDGLAVADASAMETRRATRIGAPELVAAGIDLILRPINADTELRALIDAVERRQLDPERVHDAARRGRARAEMAGSAAVVHDGGGTDAEWLAEVAERAVAVVRGFRVRVTTPAEVVIVADSSGHAPSLFAALADGIGDAGGDSSGVRHVPAPGAARTTLLVVVLPASGSDADADPSAAVHQRASAVCAAARRMGRDVAALWCGPPARSPALPDATLLLACWTPTDAMLRAAGRWLIRRV